MEGETSEFDRHASSELMKMADEQEEEEESWKLKFMCKQSYKISPKLMWVSQRFVPRSMMKMLHSLQAKYYNISTDPASYIQLSLSITLSLSFSLPLSGFLTHFLQLSQQSLARAEAAMLRLMNKNAEM